MDPMEKDGWLESEVRLSPRSGKLYVTDLKSGISSSPFNDRSVKDLDVLAREEGETPWGLSFGLSIEPKNAGEDEEPVILAAIDDGALRGLLTEVNEWLPPPPS